MIIRRAKIEDAFQLAALSDQLGYPSSQQQTVNRLRHLLNSQNDHVLVACVSEGKIAGWIHIFAAHRLESDPFAEIGGFIVSENYRGLGTGTRLLAAAEKWIHSRNIASVRIRSNTVREQAHNFFIRRGFTCTKDQRVFDKNVDQL